MPSSKVYRHSGGLGEERARLLSISDGVDYQSGSESGGVSSSTSALPRPLQAARSASLQLVAEMDSSSATAEAVVKSKSDPEVDINEFTDLTEYGAEDFKP